jgi:nucleoside-diphosphate-sugar epimerase
MSKILVTGSSGFIGKYVVSRARELGHEVVEFDTKGNRDILDRDKIRVAIKGCDSVIHLAAVVGNQNQLQSELDRIYQINVLGFLNVIELAREEGIKRFLYASSCAVYGRYGHLIGPFKEDMDISYSKEENHYGKTKMINEMIAASFHDAIGMETIGIRIMNAYGIGELEKGGGGCVISYLVKQHLSGKTIEMFDNGAQRRDFIYVTDCVEIILDLLAKAPNGVYNIGTGIATSIKGLAAIVGGDVVNKPNPNSYYPLLVQADMTKTFAVIGKRPLISVKDGIAKTIEYYRQNPLPKK